MTETTTAQTMAVLAELVLMATRHNLPMPLYLTASEKNSQLNLTLNNRADLEAWHQVFGGGRLWECAPTASSPSVLVTNMHSGSMLGWSVNLQANVPLPLSPEVLAALGEAARSDAAVLVAEAVAVLDDCTCDLNLRQVCNTCQGVPAPVKAVPAADDRLTECTCQVSNNPPCAWCENNGGEPCCDDHGNICGVVEYKHAACCDDCPEFAGAVAP